MNQGPPRDENPRIDIALWECSLFPTLFLFVSTDGHEWTRMVKTTNNKNGFLKGRPPCRPGSDSPKRRALPSAWKRAEAYGIDMSLLEANLRLSVAERLRRRRPRDQEAVLQQEPIRMRGQDGAKED